MWNSIFQKILKVLRLNSATIAIRHKTFNLICQPVLGYIKAARLTIKSLLGNTISVNSSFREALKEKKFLWIIAFSLFFTQIHKIAFLFPEGNTFKVFGIQMITSYYGSWQILIGMIMFVGSGALLSLFLIIILPRLYFRYYLPLIVAFSVNSAQVIDLLMDSRLTHIQKIFNPWYTTIPLFLILALLFRGLIHQSPSEQNRKLRARIKKLTNDELVDIFHQFLTIKYSVASIHINHDPDRWKEILIELSETGSDQVVRTIKSISHE